MNVIFYINPCDRNDKRFMTIESFTFPFPTRGKTVFAPYKLKEMIKNVK